MKTPLSNFPPLVCPHDHLPLELCSSDFLESLNKRIAAGEIRGADGATVTTPVEGALLRSDAKVAYPIRGGIPIVLPSAALHLS